MRHAYKQRKTYNMKIGFDAKRAAQNRTGLGNYSRFVLRILTEHRPGGEYHLYIPNPRRTEYLSEIPGLRGMTLHFPQGLWRHIRQLWRVWGMTAAVRHDGIGIYHGLSNELPLNIRRAGCRTVVTIHDLIFLRTPQYYHWIDRKIYAYKFRRACRLADRVIAVSEFTKREIMSCYGTPAEKIDVVYQGCDPAFAAGVPQDKAAGVSRRYGLPERFILYVGSIEERKNLMLAARALCLLRRRGEPAAADMAIVAVGRRTAYTAAIEAYLRGEGMADCFRFCHGVPFADLPAFYSLATAFVYPSRIEGFGIPILEALSAGMPVIACTGSCLEEAGGPESIYVGPDDAEGMADALLRVWTDSTLRQRMAAAGRDYARRFSDERLCDDLMRVYGKLTSASAEQNARA